MLRVSFREILICVDQREVELGSGKVRRGSGLLLTWESRVFIWELVGTKADIKNSGFGFNSWEIWLCTINVDHVRVERVRLAVLNFQGMTL